MKKIILLLFFLLTSCDINRGFNLRYRPNFQKYEYLHLDPSRRVPSQLIEKLGEPDIKSKYIGLDSCYIYSTLTKYAEYCFTEEGRLIGEGDGLGRYNPIETKDEYYLDTGSDYSDVENSFKSLGVYNSDGSDSSVNVLVEPSFNRNCLISCLKNQDWQVNLVYRDSQVWAETHKTSLIIRNISKDSSALGLLNLFKNLNLGSMKSIRHTNLLFFDGTGISVLVNYKGTKNQMSWRASSYDDRRYNQIQKYALRICKE